MDWDFLKLLITIIIFSGIAGALFGMYQKNKEIDNELDNKDKRG